MQRKDFCGRRAYHTRNDCRVLLQDNELMTALIDQYINISRIVMLMQHQRVQLICIFVRSLVKECMRSRQYTAVIIVVLSALR